MESAPDPLYGNVLCVEFSRMKRKLKTHIDVLQVFSLENTDIQSLIKKEMLKGLARTNPHISQEEKSRE